MIIFIIIPLIIASVLSFFLIEDLVIEKVENTHKNVVNMMASDINDMVDEVIDTTNLYGKPQTNILDHMKNIADSETISSYEIYQNYQEISDYLSIAFSSVSSLNPETFYMNKEQLLMMGNNNGLTHEELHNRLDPRLTQEEMAEINPNQTYFLPAEDLNLAGVGETSPRLYAVRAYKDFVANEVMGILYLGISADYFAQLFRDVESGAFQLLDQEGQSLVRSAGYQALEAEDDLLITKAAIPSTDWELVYYVPSGDIMNEITSTFSFYAVIIAVCILLFLGMSFFIAGNIYRPMHRLKNTVEAFGEGDLQVRYPVETKDEIGLLGGAFNNMLDQINHLLEKVKQEEAEKRQLELRALFAQIRPHFLINTLNSIKCSLLLEDDAVHSKKIESLTRLLRANMRAEELTTIREECNLLYDYIEIMKLRSDLPIELRTTISEELESFKVPRLLLQPIIENAIIHGFFDMPEAPVIEVQVTKQLNDVVIEVSDNGVGMDQASRHQILQHIQTEDYTSDHIGMRNIYQRLKLTYKQTDIDILPNEWGGTTVMFAISSKVDPLIEER